MPKVGVGISGEAQIGLLAMSVNQLNLKQLVLGFTHNLWEFGFDWLARRRVTSKEEMRTVQVGWLDLRMRSTQAHVFILAMRISKSIILICLHMLVVPCYYYKYRLRVIIKIG